MYGSGIREIQNKLQHLHVEVAGHCKTLTQDKWYANDKLLNLLAEKMFIMPQLKLRPNVYIRLE